MDNTNLHIQPTFSLLDGAGVSVPGVPYDIDGDERGTPPDIGADEYEFLELADDYGVIQLLNIAPTYVTEVPVMIDADIRNFGTAAQTDVPVRLFYNGVQQSEILVSLAADERDTVQLAWTPPATGYEVGTLEVQSFLSGDLYPDNDSSQAEATVVGSPMCGTYDIGGGNNDFANFTDAVTSLALRGLDCSVVFDVYAGTYDEAITIPAVAGVDVADNILFQSHDDDVVTLTNGTAPQIVLFDHAGYVVFDDIDLVATGGTNICAVIDNSSTGVRLKNLSVTGRDSTSTSVKGITVSFNNTNNTSIDNCVIRNATYGVRCEGGSGTCNALEVSGCDISGASYGIYLDESPNAFVYENDIQPHPYSSTASCYGIYVATQTANDTIYVFNNRIHNLRHPGTSNSPSVAGIYSTANKVVYAINNFIWDWHVNGQDCYGLYSSSGENNWYNNSVRMNDQTSADFMAGIYVSTGTANIVNNIFEIDEQELACHGIRRNGGTIGLSDNNAFYGTGAAFYVGRDGTTDYTTLNDWTTGTGRDANSVVGDPGFVSESDLHIQSSFTLLDGAGIALPEVTFDIDGELRNDPPDIGADEYSAVPPAIEDLVIQPDPDNGNILLFWSASPGAQSYDVYAGNPTPDTYIGSTETTSFTEVGGYTSADDVKFYQVLANSEGIPGANRRTNGTVRTTR